MSSILRNIFPPSAKNTELTGVSTEEINKRTATIERIENIFSAVKPGQKLVNASQYLQKLNEIQKGVAEDIAKLHNPNIKVTAEVEKARAALIRQIGALQKVVATAKSANIIPAIKTPWDGKLRDAKDTHLHWAVRNHNLDQAVEIGWAFRRQCLSQICQVYSKKVTDAKVAAILKKSNIMPRLIDAIELIHAQNHLKLDSKELQTLFKDPDILAIVQDPNFRKFLADPEVQNVLNNLLICGILDTRGLSPLDEALLQNDPEMINRILFPHHFKNEKLQKMCSSRTQELKVQMSKMRQVDPNDLSDVCKAAYLGDIDQLMMETNFNKKDPKGLTPLHYAILGGRNESIEYLLERTDIYSLTPQGHSYLDYAIVTGHALLFRFFQQHYKLPFKLASEQQKFSYLYASGIVNQQLTAIAKAKDPLAMGGQDQNLGGINLNAVWSGAALFNWATGYDPKTWIGWFGHGVQSQANLYNRHAVGLGQVLKMLPTSVAEPLNKVYAYYHLALFALIPGQLIVHGVKSLAELAGYKPPDFNQAINKALEAPFGKISNVVSRSFTVLRMVGAIKPVIERVPVYRDNFTSRPTAVMKCIAGDAFNIITQALMSYSSWPEAAKP